MSDDEREHSLLYPFIVCTSNGGPYNDDAFAAGCWFGLVMTECKTIAAGREKRWTVPTPLVGQLDLLAMHEGLVLIAEPWDEHPDAWTIITLQRPGS